MTPLFVRPIRYRLKLTPEEKLAAFKTALGQYCLGCIMVLTNLVVPLSGAVFGFYFLPIITMFVLACVISLTLRKLRPRDATHDEGLAAVLVFTCIGLCLYRQDFVFNQHLLGDWHVTNIFSAFTIIHLAAFIVAAFLIPRDDCWLPLRIAALLAGMCIVGVGLPDGGIAEPARCATYLCFVSTAATVLVNLDVAKCFRAWCASSPQVDLTRSGQILSLHSFTYCFISPWLFLPDTFRFYSVVWRAQVLWLSGWPVPPESLDPKLLELSHFAPLRRAGVRRFVATLSQASILALWLLLYPPASFANPYLVFAAELLAPPLAQFFALAFIHGWFLVTANDLSKPPQKGTP